MDGRIKVYTTEGGTEKVLAFYAEGQVLGEMALLTGEPRSASAVAMGDVRVLELAKDDFDTYLSGNVNVMREMMRVIALRQQQTNIRLAREQEQAVDDTPTAPKGRGRIYVVFG